MAEPGTPEPIGAWYERAADAIVGTFSPRRAFLRQHFRRMERDGDYRQGVEALLRANGYRKRGNSYSSHQGYPHQGLNRTPFGVADWDNRSADAVNLLHLKRDRARSRYLARTNAIASGLLRNTAREVVGSGIWPQSVAESRNRRAASDLRRNLESVFADACETLFPADGVDLREHQELMTLKLLEDGESMAKLAATGAAPLWIETIEADRLDWPVGAATPRGNTIRGGVERDASNRIVAYHVAKWHPGDVAVPNSPAISKPVPLTPKDYDRVTPDVARHLALRWRPGQSHGTPWLSPVLDDLNNLDLLIEASLKRVQVAACLSVFITSESQWGDILDATAEDYGYQIDEDIVPGMMFRLAPGEKVETVSPNFPVTDLDTFIKALARRIGAALGVSYLAVLGDASGYNYSSARTDLLRDRRLYRSLQDKLINGYLRWLWVHVLEDARLRGDPRMRGVTDEQIRRVAWIKPGWEWVDPRNEAEAIGKKLELGLTTLRDEAAALGKDYEDLIRQSALEAAMREAAAAEARESLGLDTADQDNDDEAGAGGPNSADASEGRAAPTPTPTRYLSYVAEAA